MALMDQMVSRVLLVSRGPQDQQEHQDHQGPEDYEVPRVSGVYQAM